MQRSKSPSDCITSGCIEWQSSNNTICNITGKSISIGHKLPDRLVQGHAINM